MELEGVGFRRNRSRANDIHRRPPPNSRSSSGSPSYPHRTALDSLSRKSAAGPPSHQRLFASQSFSSKLIIWLPPLIQPRIACAWPPRWLLVRLSCIRLGYPARMAPLEDHPLASTFGGRHRTPSQRRLVAGLTARSFKVAPGKEIGPQFLAGEI